MIWKAKKPEAVMVEEIDGKFRFVITYKILWFFYEG
jgi:hypothetical protein